MFCSVGILTDRHWTKQGALLEATRITRQLIEGELGCQEILITLTVIKGAWFKRHQASVVYVHKY